MTGMPPTIKTKKARVSSGASSSSSKASEARSTANGAKQAQSASTPSASTAPVLTPIQIKPSEGERAQPRGSYVTMKDLLARLPEPVGKVLLEFKDVNYYKSKNAKSSITESAYEIQCTTAIIAHWEYVSEQHRTWTTRYSLEVGY